MLYCTVLYLSRNTQQCILNYTLCAVQYITLYYIYGGILSYIKTSPFRTTILQPKRVQKCLILRFLAIIYIFLNLIFAIMHFLTNLTLHICVFNYCDLIFVSQWQN